MSSWMQKYFTSLFCGGEDETSTPRKDFTASAAEFVEPIIKKQYYAKALHDEFAPEVNKINALLKKSGIDKTIEWELSGEDNTGLTLAARGENSHKEYLVLEASETGSFFSTHSREQCLSKENGPIGSSNQDPRYYIGSDTDKNIDMINAVIQNHVLSQDEMKKVGFAVHGLDEHAKAPRGHSRPSPGIEIKGP